MLKPGLLTRRELLLGTASVLVARRIARAQRTQLPPRPTFSAEVEVVNVLVTVRDKKGGIVKDLGKEEFTLSEDGRPQTITYFSRETDLPLAIGLLVDTTPSESTMLEAERRASISFLHRMLRPEKDTAFVMQYYDKVELLQGLTSSYGALEDALYRLESHGLADGGGGRGPGGQGVGRGKDPFGGRGSDPSGGRSPSRPPGRNGYEAVLADAIELGSREIGKSEQGRRALFILGDGDHIGERLEQAIAAAQQADALIYAIRIYDKDFGGGGRSGWGIQLPGVGWVGGAPGRGGGGGTQGGGSPKGGPDSGGGKQTLKELAKQTGGAYFEAGKKETLDDIYGIIEEELRSQYSLGYTPAPNALDGYRKIKVEVKRKGMVVRGREGYYPRGK
jgi:VWFA-related protein